MFTKFKKWIHDDPDRAMELVWIVVVDVVFLAILIRLATS
jgi:hypothetical protein